MQHEVNRCGEIIEVVPHPVDIRVWLHGEREATDAEERILSRGKVKKMRMELNRPVVFVTCGVGYF